MRRRLDQYANRLAGSPPPVSDPHAPPNRSSKRRIRLAVAGAVLILMSAGAAMFWRANRGGAKDQASAAAPAALPAKLYQEVLKASELEVSELFLQKNVSPPVVRGSVRNNSDQMFESAEISFNVTNKEGMLLGAVSTTVRNVPPHGSQEFSVVVPQKDAAIVLVRDARRL